MLRYGVPRQTAVVRVERSSHRPLHHRPKLQNPTASLHVTFSRTRFCLFSVSTKGQLSSWLKRLELKSTITWTRFPYWTVGKAP